MKTARLQTCTIAVAAVAVLGAACNRNEPAETSTVPTAQAPATTPAYETEEARSDSGITTAVQAKYYGDATVRGRDVDVTTNSGVVTLRGTVESEASRQQAQRLAEGVHGVTSVDNRLQVEGAERPAATTGTNADTRPARSADADDRVDGAWLTTKIQAQYYTNPGLRPWNIDVTSSSDGVVTLRGEVDNAADRQQAVTIARNTEGVTRVDDNLRVRGTDTAARGTDAPKTSVTQPDGWITAKIQAKYFMDGDVKGHEIDVDTANGVVTLKGAVESETARRQAEALARNTDGVRDVQNQLTTKPVAEPVGPLPNAREAGRDIGAKIEDALITTKIQSKYFLDGDVKGHEINVDTRSGVVTLKGAVESEAQKKEAEQIASMTDGVTSVVNRLTIEVKR